LKKDAKCFGFFYGAYKTGLSESYHCAAEACEPTALAVTEILHCAVFCYSTNNRLLVCGACDTKKLHVRGSKTVVTITRTKDCLLLPTSRASFMFVAGTAKILVLRIFLLRCHQRAATMVNRTSVQTISSNIFCANTESLDESSSSQNVLKHLS